jgi:hypothetical protein
MKTKILIQFVLFFLAMGMLSGCQAIGDIFKAGMGVGIFMVVIVIIIIIFIATRIGKGGAK